MKRGLELSERVIAEFTRAMEREEREASTIEAYQRTIRQFAAWLDGDPADKERAIAWKQALCMRGCRASTVNAKLAAVNKLFTSLGRERLKVRYLRIQRRAFRSADRELTRTEYQKLVDTAYKSGNPRLGLLMETICATGIRVSEVRYITLEAAKAGAAEVALKGKIRTILLPRKLCRKILHYAKAQKIRSGEIFITRSGKSLSRKFIWAEMKRCCAKAGAAPSKVFPHNLRHLFARTFYRLCRDVVRLADVLGHSSIETTRIYLMTTGKEYARQLDRLGFVS